MVALLRSGAGAGRRGGAAPWLGVGAALAAGLILACRAGPADVPDARPAVLSVGYPQPASQTGPSVGVTQVASLLTDDGLVRTTRVGEHAPRLAESWTPLDEGRTIRIVLKSGVVLHDGSALTPAVVKASLDFSRGDPAALAQYPMLRQIERIETGSEPGTLLIRLREASDLLLDDLEVPIRKQSPDGRWVGTGPFVVQDETPDSTTLRAHASYHEGRPSIDIVHLRTFPTIRTAWAAMMRGEIDFLYEVPRDVREFVEGESSVQVFSFLRPYVYVLALNMKRPPLASRHVRRALNLAVDRALIVRRALRGYGQVATGLWPLHWAYAPETPDYAHDPEDASALLAAEGFEMPDVAPAAVDGFPSRLRFACLVPVGMPTYEQIAVLIQKQLYDIGVHMALDAVPIDEFIRRVGAADYDATVLDLNGGPGLVRAYTFWRSAEQGFVFGHAASGAALERVRFARSRAELGRAVAAFQRILHDDPPAVFLAWGETARAVSRRFAVPDEQDQDVVRTLWRWRPTAAGSRAGPS